MICIIAFSPSFSGYWKPPVEQLPGAQPPPNEAAQEPVPAGPSFTSRSAARLTEAQAMDRAFARRPFVDDAGPAQAKIAGELTAVEEDAREATRALLGPSAGSPVPSRPAPLAASPASPSASNDPRAVVRPLDPAVAALLKGAGLLGQYGPVLETEEVRRLG